MSHPSKYLILFDTTKAGNDKQWLHLEAKKAGLDCKALHTPWKLSSMERKSAFHRMLSRLIMGAMAVRARVFFPRHTIVAWSFLQGLIAYLTLGPSQKLIAMTWLSPPAGEDRRRPIMYRMARDSRVSIIVNSRDSVARWADYLELDQAAAEAAMTVVPDVFRIDTAFEPCSPREDRYVFSGGMANRDWGFLMEVAAALPQIRFECVALKEDWEAKTAGGVPDNVTVRFNTPSEVYYDLMDRATLVLLPLERDRVSGLINITRSMQKSILCLVTDYPCTQQYFSPAMAEKYLLEKDLRQWTQRIREVFQLPREAYQAQAQENQNFLQENFSPAQAVKKIYKIP